MICVTILVRHSLLRAEFEGGCQLILPCYKYEFQIGIIFVRERLELRNSSILRTWKIIIIPGHDIFIRFQIDPFVQPLKQNYRERKNGKVNSQNWASNL